MKKQTITVALVVTIIATITLSTTPASASISLPGLNAFQNVNSSYEWGQSTNTNATFETNSGGMPGEWWVENVNVDVRIGEIVDYIRVENGNEVTWEEVLTGEYWFSMNLNVNGTFADEMGISDEVINASRGISLGDLSAYINFNISEKTSEWRGDYLNLNVYGNLSNHFAIERESLNFYIYEHNQGEFSWNMNGDFNGIVDLSTWQADIIKGSNLYGGVQAIVVPEPASLVLLGIGGLGMFIRRNCRK